jgi:general secretion pathway protein L
MRRGMTVSRAGRNIDLARDGGTKRLRFMATLVDLASRFFAWWLGELSSCLPAGLRGALRRRRAILAIALGEDKARLSLRRGERWRELGSVQLRRPNAGEARRAFASALRGVSLRAVEVVIELPAERVLRRVVDLPIAAAENLREVLAFEMDRHTPFRAEEVAFDYRIVGTDPATKRVAVDLAVVPTALVEQAAAAVASFGLAAERIAIAGEAGEPSAMNLMPPAARAEGGFGRKLSLALASAAVVLAIAAAYLPLYEEQNVLAAYETRLAQSRAAAAEADKLKKQVAAALERARFLVDRRISTPTTLALLKELTDRLPDDAWLVDLRLHGDQISLSGFSPAAASLIAVLDASHMISQTRFASPVIADPRAGLERFNLSAVVAAEPGG